MRDNHDDGYDGVWQICLIAVCLLVLMFVLMRSCPA